MMETCQAIHPREVVHLVCRSASTWGRAAGKREWSRLQAPETQKRQSCTRSVHTGLSPVLRFFPFCFLSPDVSSVVVVCGTIEASEVDPEAAAAGADAEAAAADIAAAGALDTGAADASDDMDGVRT